MLVLCLGFVFQSSNVIYKVTQLGRVLNQQLFWKIFEVIALPAGSKRDCTTPGDRNIEKTVIPHTLKQQNFFFSIMPMPAGFTI